MKIILSRKGFDSGSGKVASPIFSSGELFSLPIPEDQALPSSNVRYGEISAGNYWLGDIVDDLTLGQIRGDRSAHLDPDLNFSSVPRQNGWKPIFGQANAAERHLQNHQVDKGDIFIFFGWFKRVERVANRFRYVKGAPDLHVMFGWLQIDRRIAVRDLHQIPIWALEHPHLDKERTSQPDSIYIASDRLKLPDQILTDLGDRPGAGVFKTYRDALCLTAPGQLRSHWQLPAWFYHDHEQFRLTYNQDFRRWQLAGEGSGFVLLKTPGRGQEFILNCEHYPKAIDWLCGLFSNL
jgi:Nucleotide modification associated domain 3